MTSVRCGSTNTGKHLSSNPVAFNVAVNGYFHGIFPDIDGDISPPSNDNFVIVGKNPFGITSDSDAHAIFSLENSNDITG